MKHFARLPYQPEPFNLQHLRNLKPPRNLVTWLNSYEKNGFFSKELLRKLQTQENKPTTKRKKEENPEIETKETAAKKRKKCQMMFNILFSSLLTYFHIYCG